MYHILYNPLSGNGQGKSRAQTLKEKFSGQNVLFEDIREIRNYADYLSGISKEDSLVIAGGDGTVNRFVNETAGLELPENLFYYAVGSGNDFKRDVLPDGDELIPLHKYITDLPTVTVKGKTSRFLNGVGYGIDGYCCEVGDELAKKTDKPVNYAGIAIKGLLFHYKPTNAKVTVDGKEYSFKKVWLAPAMNGRFYGGGMMVSPDQNRLSGSGDISVVLMHGSGKLKTLMVFPSIFKGEHVKHTEMVTVLTGKEITVEFDRPTALQIDGETVLAVSSYTARTGKHADVAAAGV